MTKSILVSKKSLFKLRLYFLFFHFIIIFFLLIGGCGYTIEGSNPILPNEAKTISILPIQNQTFIAGLETDLSEQLNGLLRSNSSLKISPANIADLQISITLLNIKTNTYGLSKEQISSGVKATITGKTSLIDRRINKNIWNNSIIKVNLTESLENEMENTSGISISGKTRQVIKLFAAKIYDRLFNNF
tara:strand:- start:386 stop:952 length:567 start_codon:yes stop_codon:yes gene_type:complete